MTRLVIRLPSLADAYDARQHREMVRNLENSLARVSVDDSLGAYAVTGNKTLDSLDDVVLVDTSAGGITVTLPAISDEMVRNKREFEVVKTTAANVLTITPTGADTILGEPDAVVTVQWTALRFRATPANWVVI